MRRLLALLLLAACTRPPAADATGAEIYAQLCSRCHGADLEGSVGPPLGPASNAADQPDQFLVVTVTRGRGRMPSFEETLTPRQVERLVAFLRERQSG